MYSCVGLVMGESTPWQGVVEMGLCTKQPPYSTLEIPSAHITALKHYLVTGSITEESVLVFADRIIHHSSLM